MKRILLVDDDPFVLKVYQDALARKGFEVETAGDGLCAMRLLRTATPDVVVLDLMMPKFSGVEVLKYIRTQADLAKLPVIVLSNSYMEDVAPGAGVTQAHKSLLKSRCNPSVLVEAIEEVLEHPDLNARPGEVLPRQPPPSALPPPPPATRVPLPRRASLPPIPTAAPPPRAAPRKPVEDGFDPKLREDFLATAAANCTALLKLSQAFCSAATSAERGLRLQDLFRKVHFLTVAAGMAKCDTISQMASAFEALLFAIMDKPDYISPSVLRTTAQTISFFEELFRHADDASPDEPAPALALVVDDDPLSNRLAISALRQARINSESTEDSVVAWQWANQRRYDLFVLDIEMPIMNGYDLCKRLRGLPGHEKTPVIFVTSHQDFESRAESVLSGGDDLISKPVFRMELTVKAVTHLLARQFER